MSFDWIQFLSDRQIHHVTSGSNAGRNQIAIKCCWCGIDDPSEHLSINLQGKGFRCWRQPLHSGKNPAKLIQALLNCSWEQANQIAGNEKTLPSDFLGKLKAAIQRKQPEAKINNLQLPPEFKQFSNLPSCQPFNLYLRRRGFSPKDIEQTKAYGIYYASQGLYKGRVIFTVVSEGKLVGWTGRTIWPIETVRYKTLTNDPEKAADRNETPAPNPITNYLLFVDRLDSIHCGASCICLVEGPFDAWRVNILGQSIGVCATCFFTSTASKEQLNLLHEILPRFKRKILLLDKGTFAKSVRVGSDLAAFDIETRMLTDVKDPAELLTTKQLEKAINA